MVPRLHRPEGDMSAPLSLSLSLALVKPKALLASEKQGGPPSLTQVWLPHKTGRQAGASSLPHPHTATRETQAECFSQNAQSTATSVPAHPPIPSLLPPKILLFLSSLFQMGRRGGPVANRRHSQCTHACLRQFSKVPVYLLSGRCPQNIMHHTYKSFTL